MMTGAAGLTTPPCQTDNERKEMKITDGQSKLSIDILTFNNAGLINALWETKFEDEAVQNLDLIDEEDELYGTRITVDTLYDVFELMSLLKGRDHSLQLQYIYKSDVLSLDLFLNQKNNDPQRQHATKREIASIHEDKINADMKARIDRAIDTLKGVTR
jgi:hypothetical protein